jgi:hypothetical protein
MDQLLSYIQNGEMNRAVELIRQMKNFFDSQHPGAPYYKYEFGVDEHGKQYITHVPAFPGAEKIQPLKGNIKFTVPEKYRHFKTMEDLINYSYGMQQPFEVDLKSLKTWIGEKTLEEYNSGNSDKFKVKFIPQKFPPPTPMKLYVMDNSWSIDYLEIGVKEISNNRIKMDNIEQANSPFTVSFNIDIESSSAHFDISINESVINSVKYVLKFNELVEIGGRENKPLLALKMLNDDVDVMIAANWKFNMNDRNNINGLVDFLRKLYEIEKHTNISFYFPYRELEPAEIFMTETIYLSIQGEFRKQQFNTKYDLYLNSDEELERLFVTEDSNPKSFNLNLHLSCSEPLELLGAKINVEHQYVFLENIKLHDSSKLRQRYRLRDHDEPLRVRILPADENSFISEKLDIITS